MEQKELAYRTNLMAEEKASNCRPIISLGRCHQNFAKQCSLDFKYHLILKSLHFIVQLGDNYRAEFIIEK